MNIWRLLGMYKVNISIDDITPHPHSSIAVLDRCFELIDIFPDIKFTLFIPIAYYRTIPSPSRSVCEDPMYIDLFPDFCERLLELSDNNFELGYHGLYHGISGETNNDEFRSLSYNETYVKFNELFDVCENAGIINKMKPIFRPPAWKMSPESIHALRDCGINIFALHSSSEYMNIYKSEQKKKNDVVYATCYPPHEKLKLTNKTEIVYHACDWDRNYLSEDLCVSLEEFLNSSDNYEFCFMKQML